MADDWVRARLVEDLRHHLGGWSAKVVRDFAEEAVERELKALTGDPVYQQFGFATEEYVAVRLMGRMSISIGRRLGEIYDKLPRMAVKARFGLSEGDVAPVYGNLNLDIGVPLAKLSPADRRHLEALTASRIAALPAGSTGLGIEIRYNFNPNDSARLRKDVDMANYLLADDRLPIYCIFSEISPRDEAIARLKRAGWHFVVGRTASEYFRELCGLELNTILIEPEVRAYIDTEIGEIMRGIYASALLRRLAATHHF